ncbi:glutamine--tRNA ligase [endosymbiont of Pachyrhynchus infernalis]|uniref:glutamine--tRNA ligase n=1 Tax=endosymbiont of Pachyrhynchus infernalis TaxID=1971488 RepID=UPI000DC6D254|nr:glutamine--tRNA ligase [endosymbiont of Pachyrhynchus infernalis]BBA84803.1 glutamine--tRNA ligase [endosymbiont of Pachyrhynchus infernalis]
MNDYDLYFNNYIIKIIDKDIKNNKNLKIKTRFPPEPNGYLHIGHAKSIFLNFLIANKYNGECNLRFDDTNPLNIKNKYINSIKKDIDWLGFKNKYNVSYTSDYFDEIFNFAIKLINKNLAYIDKLTINKIKIYRGNLNKIGIDSPYRNNSISENIDYFIKMRNGYFKENEICLRAKIDMKSKSLLMRDPILYRVKFTYHKRTKNKWCIYPTYDFSHCICDFLENITHSLCTLEFEENKKLYNWILNNIDINGFIPKQYEFSRLNLEYNILSKRKINFLINKKIINKWYDPRICTISGLRNRGYTPNSIKVFCKKIGVTKKNSNININILENCIKTDLYENSYRIMSVIDPIKLIIENLNDNYEEEIYVPNFPNKKLSSNRKIVFTKIIYIEKSDFCECLSNTCNKFSIGKIIKLRYSYIICAKKIFKDKKGNIKSILCFLYENTVNSIYLNNIKINKIIHWVSYKKKINSTFYIYENLFLDKYPYKNKNILNIINKNSLIIKNGFIEKSNNKIIKNRIYQFERIGYFYTKLYYKDKNLIFFNIVNI